MLITFRCKSYATVTMFGDIGLQMIKMMGHSGTVPGAILAPDLPEALSKLTLSLAAESIADQKDTSSTKDVEDDEEEALSETGSKLESPRRSVNRTIKICDRCSM